MGGVILGDSYEFANCFGESSYSKVIAKSALPLSCKWHCSVWLQDPGNVLEHLSMSGTGEGSPNLGILQVIGSLIWWGISLH